MSSFVKFLAFYTFFLSLSFGSDQFQIDGNFFVKSYTGVPTTVNFTLSWNEVDGKISGTYKDNFFVGPTPMNGVANGQGRSFEVNLPRASRDIESISMATSVTGNMNGAIPFEITTKDVSHTPKDSANNISVLMSSSELGAPDKKNCTDGFGDLSGYCGLYGGLVIKSLDIGNKCHLEEAGEIRLELGDDKKLNLYMNYVDPHSITPVSNPEEVGSTVNLPFHYLGLLPNQAGTAISMNQRNCGMLVKTLFIQENCQSLHLKGSFSSVAGEKSFSGIYTITDETTHENCQYNFTFTREK